MKSGEILYDDTVDFSKPDILQEPQKAFTLKIAACFAKIRVTFHNTNYKGFFQKGKAALKTETGGRLLCGRPSSVWLSGISYHNPLILRLMDAVILVSCGNAGFPLY